MMFSRRSRSSRRGLKALAVGAVSALLLTACGGGGGSSSDTDIELRMTVWSSADAHLKLFNEIADAYKADHPEIKSITFDPLPFDSYTSTLTTQVAGGNAPDMAWVLENSAQDFVGSGALTDLAPTLKKTEGYQYDDLVPSTTQLWSDGDKLMAYPFSTSPFGVFVNTDLVGQAGQVVPSEAVGNGSWTWETALATNAAVQQQTGKAGLVVRDFDYKNWDNLASFWRGWGADAWSEDGTRCGFNSPEMTEAMTAFHKGVFEDKAMPGPGTAPDFFAGDAAMTITQISRASLLKDAPFKWELVPLPTGKSGPYAVIGQAGVGVMSQSKHAEASAEFLAYFTNPENAKKMSQFFPPPRASLLTADALAEANPLLSSEQLQQVVIDGVQRGKVKPVHTNQAELAQQVRAALDPLWTADADVPAVLNGVCSAIEPQLRP